MNYLHLVPRSVFETKMARERFIQVDALRAVPDSAVVTWGPGWPEWDVNMSIVENVERFCRATYPAHLIIAYGLAGSLLGGPVPVAVILQEAYDRRKTDQLIRAMDPRLVVFTYANELPQYEHFAAEGRVCVAVPHGVEPGPMAVAYPELLALGHAGFADRPIDVLIVGNMNETIYPVRVHLAHLAWRELRKRGYKVVWAPHPGYTLPPKVGVVGREYLRLLGQAKLVVTCTSRYRYALTKLLEIPMAGALPVTDLPGERQRFFSHTGLIVSPSMLDREILGLMEGMLDDAGAWELAVKIARERVEDRCLMTFWAERFHFHARVAILGESPAPPRPVVSEEDAES